jgi:hypothetical protein
VRLYHARVGTSVTDTSARTAVGIGMMRIVDDPEIVSQGKIPISLWMINDVDDSTTDDAPKTVMRIFTQGRDLQGGDNVKDKSRTALPVPFLLKSDRGLPHILDLSIYGTPTGKSDQEIIIGKGGTGFAHANIEDVEVFGSYTVTLPVVTTSTHAIHGNCQAKTNPDRAKKTVGKSSCHVYVFTNMDMASVQIFAVYARDGEKIAKLGNSSFDEVFEDGKLRGEWHRRKGQVIGFVQLRQAARRRPPSCRQDLLRPATNSPSYESEEHSDTINVNPLKRSGPQTMRGPLQKKGNQRLDSLEL